MAPPKAELYTFMNCPNHQYPATMMLRIKTILLVLELVSEVKLSFINFKSMGEHSFAYNVLGLGESAGNRSTKAEFITNIKLKNCR
jgi:hypothetical protein